MPNEVFANGLEVACKVADGVSTAAFPDPCWSPPFPSAGKVLIPYANTAFAKDLTNASKTVMITGKPVALKDYSFFKTSSGNEPATMALGMGKKTGVIKGKTYFRSWSMDVFIEGYNVCRHTDKMTHNHGSDPGNTGNWTYIDTATTERKCRRDRNRVKDECEIKDGENRRFRRKQEKRARRHNPPRRVTPRDKTWKDKNCLGLMIKPTNIESLESRLNDFQNEVMEVMHDIDQVIIDLMVDKAADFGVRAGAKHAAALGCTVFSPAGTAACETGVFVYNVGDGIYTAVTGAMDVFELKDEIGALRDQLNTGLEYIEQLDKYRKGEITKDEFWEHFRDQMKEMVANNDCLKARKCMLSPYNKSQTANSHGTDRNTVRNHNTQGRVGSADDLFGQLGNASVGGCCPGQTGHHLLPEAWFKNCPAYTNSVHRAAPVVCAEGTGHSDGTHGTFHTETDEITKQHLGEVLSMSRAIELAAEAHKNAVDRDFGERWFGMEHCDPDCIKAQLDTFYKQIDCEPVPTTKDGSTEQQTTEGSGVE
ncbi:PAAR-like domain-containing protein [Neptunomonas phycophila]|uniref:PAAR-like domain-containing protein n=1 Tax=Neptunomonas phycophila TaxID=1572645 RepID=UPI0037353563